MKKSIIFAAIILISFVFLGIGYYLDIVKRRKTGTTIGTIEPIAVSKTKVIIINSPLNESKNLSFLKVKNDTTQTIWSLDLPSDASFNGSNIEFNDSLLIVSLSMDNDRKIFIVRLADGKLLKKLPFSDSWSMLDGGDFLFQDNGAFTYYENKNDTLDIRWQTENPDSNDFFVKIDEIGEKIIIDQGKMFFVLDKISGEIIDRIGSGQTVGISKKTNEIIVDLDRVLKFHSLDNGKIRSVNLKECFANDTIYNDIYLIGRNRNNLLFIYAKDLPTTIVGNKQRYTIPSNYKMIAVDDNTLEISWQLEIGKWEWGTSYGVNLSNFTKISSDKEFNDKQLFHTLTYAPGAEKEDYGHFSYIDLINGLVIWQNKYVGATRSNVLSQQIGNYFYLRVVNPEDYSKSALAQFENGQLKKAVWIPDDGLAWYKQIQPEAIWFCNYRKSWFQLNPADLSLGVSLQPNIELVDATEWVRKKLNLKNFLK